MLPLVHLAFSSPSLPKILFFLEQCLHISVLYFFLPIICLTFLHLPVLIKNKIFLTVIFSVGALLLLVALCRYDIVLVTKLGNHFFTGEWQCPQLHQCYQWSIGHKFTRVVINIAVASLFHPLLRGPSQTSSSNIVPLNSCSVLTISSISSSAGLHVDPHVT